MALVPTLVKGEYSLVSSAIRRGQLNSVDTTRQVGLVYEEGRGGMWALLELPQRLRWPRLSEQFFRVDKWSVCRG